MAAPAPPQIVVDDPKTTDANIPSGEPTPKANGGPNRTPSPKPTTPAIDTSEATKSAASFNTQQPTPTTRGILKRTNTLNDTPIESASCYLCDEQNPGDFTPTTKYLSACLLCSRYFCPIHQSAQYESVCNINHSSYYHTMLQQARALLDAQAERDNATPSTTSPGGTRTFRGRPLAEVLINEGIYPSLGEREKAIFATSPVDEQQRRELESWRSLEAAVANGGERGRKEPIEEREALGADIAI